MVHLLRLPIFVLRRLSAHVENHHLRVGHCVLGADNGYRPVRCTDTVDETEQLVCHKRRDNCEGDPCGINKARVSTGCRLHAQVVVYLY